MKRLLLTIVTVVLASTLAAGVKKGAKTYGLPMPDELARSLKPSALLASSDEPAINAPAEPDKTVRGIDVSHHQGVIDWSKAAADPQVAYCYIKATEGANYIDDCYERNVRQARAAGVLVGAYHFFSPTATPVSQLNNMKATVRLQDNDLLPLIDVEKIGRRANVNAFCQRLRTFLKGVERHYGVRPLIYTGVNFYNKYLAGRFTDYRFMIAKYREPAPVLHDKKTEILMWQYSCTGSIDGVRGDCDQSMFLDNYNIKDILIR